VPTRPAGKARRWALLGPAACVLALSASGGESRNIDVFDLLRSAGAAPSTRALAAHEGFALDDVPVGDAGAAAGPGDSITALVGLSSFDGRLAPRQWIIRLRLAGLKAQAVATRDVTYYTNVGDAFVFHSAVTAMELETLGPVQADSGPGLHLDPKRRRIAVNTDFLTLNLNRTVTVLVQMKEREKKSPGLIFDLTARTEAFSPAELEAGRRGLQVFDLTAADRRSFAGSVPALAQFLDIVRNAPDLQGILMEVLDKPSVIDVLRHGAQANLAFNFIGAGPSQGRELFWKDGRDHDFGLLAFALEVFGKPALMVALYVTPPRPPLEVSAGILGLVAWSPSKPDKVVVVRVLSSRPGGAPAAPPGPAS
jgi:hypothetical protein